MAYMKVAFVMLTILPSASSASLCEEDGSCPVGAKADSLLQTRGTVGAVSISEDAEEGVWDNFARYMNYTLAGIGGNSIMLRADGFEGVASDFDGTMPGCYAVCMAQTDPPCLAFTFASPVWRIKTNRWCSLHLELGSMFHRNEFFMGFPNSRRVDLSSDGDFWMKRIGDVGSQKNCLTQVDSHFESIACDAANPNQKWHRDQEGIYINRATGQCIANKDDNIQAVAVPESLAGEPLVTCAKKFYMTNHDFYENNLFLERLDSYDVPDGDEATWDGVSWRKFWESGSVPERSSHLVVKSASRPRKYSEVNTFL